MTLSLSSSSSSSDNNATTKATFPEKLHMALDAADKNGFCHVISWISSLDGSHDGFVIRDKEAFEAEILPKFFCGIQLKSFQRQLNIYDFVRVRDGPNKNEYAYVHELFVRGRPELCDKMVRRKVKKRDGSSSNSDSSSSDNKAVTLERQIAHVQLQQRELQIENEEMLRQVGGRQSTGGWSISENGPVRSQDVHPEEGDTLNFGGRNFFYVAEESVHEPPLKTPPAEAVERPQMPLERETSLGIDKVFSSGKNLWGKKFSSKSMISGSSILSGFSAMSIPLRDDTNPAEAVERPQRHTFPSCSLPRQLIPLERETSLGIDKVFLSGKNLREKKVSSKSMMSGASILSGFSSMSISIDNLSGMFDNSLKKGEDFEANPSSKVPRKSICSGRSSWSGMSLELIKEGMSMEMSLDFIQEGLESHEHGQQENNLQQA